MSEYPAILKFNLRDSGPLGPREKTLVAAEQLGLEVKHHTATEFDVVITAPMQAYEFGRLAGVAVLLREADK